MLFEDTRHFQWFKQGQKCAAKLAVRGLVKSHQCLFICFLGAIEVHVITSKERTEDHGG